jgi:hypothetical protein
MQVVSEPDAHHHARPFATRSMTLGIPAVEKLLLRLFVQLLKSDSAAVPSGGQPVHYSVLARLDPADNRATATKVSQPILQVP